MVDFAQARPLNPLASYNSQAMPISQRTSIKAGNTITLRSPKN